jgi:hypothetical protein
VALEKRDGVLGLRENRLEKTVVGMRGGGERFFGGFHKQKLGES